MGLIEQAAKRLEELRRAGVEVNPSPEPLAPAAAATHAAPTGEHAGAPPRARKKGTRAVKLDLERLAALGFVTPDLPQSHLADEFRILKRPLLTNAGPKGVKHGNLIMVTSSVPKEGKTFTAVNLAMSIAMEQDRTVLLVDGDVARPSIPGTFSMKPQPGLMDVLADATLDLSSVLIRTNVPRLTLLTAGSPHPRAAEMLASEAMIRCLSELASRYPDRVVIFDSPPLLATTEARQLASRMGQIVFVVHAETTLQHDVRSALATIESCPIKLLVLNAATTARQGAYGYGYGYKHDNAREPRA